MAYKIEKDVPLSSYNIKSRKYPFDQMEVGDSFFAPYPDAKKARQNAISRNKGKYRKLPKNIAVQRHFVTRTVEGGVRIWRTK